MAGNRTSEISGIILCDLGLYGLSQYYLHKAKGIHEAHGSHAIVAVSLGEIAIAQMRDGELKAARQNYAAALSLAQSRGYEGAVGLFERYRSLLGDQIRRMLNREVALPGAQVSAMHASRLSRLRVFIRRIAFCILPPLACSVALYIFRVQHGTRGAMALHLPDPLGGVSLLRVVDIRALPGSSIVRSS